MDMNDYKNECRACGKEAYTCAAVALLNSHLKLLSGLYRPTLDD